MVYVPHALDNGTDLRMRTVSEGQPQGACAMPAGLVLYAALLFCTEEVRFAVGRAW